MNKRRVRRAGFTLIEMMIAVGIIGILAAVAIPNYIRYQLRSKTTEARMNIDGIRINQIAFAASYDNYASPAVQPATVPGTIKVAWPGTACPSTCNRTNPTACTQFACLGFKPTGRVYYQYAGAAQTASSTQRAEFAIGAVGDLDGDGNTGSFAFQSNNGGTALGVIADGISACGSGRNANQVIECNYGRY